MAVAVDRTRWQSHGRCDDFAFDDFALDVFERTNLGGVDMAVSGDLPPESRAKAHTGMANGPDLCAAAEPRRDHRVGPPAT